MSFSKYNPALLCDFYEFTMGNGYFLSGKKDGIACFDLFFRRVPTPYYSYIFLSELSFLNPLCDPNNRLTKMKASVQTYPPKLKAAIIETFMGRAWTWIQNFHYDTAVMRADTLFTAPIVLHTVLDRIQVIFAINEEYFTGDKKLLQTLSKLAYCPKDLLQQLDKLLTAAPNAADLKEQQQLLYKIFFEVKEHLPR